MSVSELEQSSTQTLSRDEDETTTTTDELLESSSAPVSSLGFQSGDVEVEDEDEFTPDGSTDTSTTGTGSSEPPPAPGPSYTVVSGDTLGIIARDALGDAGKYTQIAQLNGITNPDKITVGQVLVLPKGATVPVREVESSSSESSTTPSQVLDDSSQQQIQSATNDLGKMDALDGGFYSSGGKLIDGLVPTVGQTGSVELSAEIPLDASGTATAVFTFKASVNRNSKGVKGTIEVSFEAGVGQELDLWVTTAEVFAKAGVKGTIESQGGNGEEVLRLMGLSIRQRIAGLSESVADVVFDKGTIDDTIEGMGEDDYVESTLAGTASVGAKLGSGTSEESGGELSAEGGRRTKLTRGSGGDLEEEHITYGKVSASVDGNIKGFGVKGTLSGETTRSDKSGTEGKLTVQVEGSAPVKGEDIEDLVTGGSYISESLTALGGLVDAAKANVSGTENVRMASSLGRYLIASSGTATAVEQSAIDAAKELKAVGATVDFKMTGAAAVNHKGELGFQLKLSKENAFSFEGGVRKAKVKVLVSNLQDVINVAQGLAI